MRESRKLPSQRSEGMIQVNVVYSGPFKSITGVSQETIDLPANSTLRDLLQLLSRRYGTDFENYLFLDGQLSREVLLLCDGLHVRGESGLDRCLAQDSQTEIEVGFLGPIPVGG